MSIKFEYNFAPEDSYFAEIYYHEVEEKDVKRDIMKLAKIDKITAKDFLDFIDDRDLLQEFVDYFAEYYLKDWYYYDAKSDYEGWD